MKVERIEKCKFLILKGTRRLTFGYIQRKGARLLYACTSNKNKTNKDIIHACPMKISTDTSKLE